METLTLARQPSTDEGVFGQIFRAGQQLCVTAELPWRDNQHEISCIPVGLYLCIPHNSPAHPHTWEVANVPNRSEILIHNANLPSQLKGCIGVGDTYGTIDGHKAVLHSMLTMDRLRAELPDTFYLRVQ